MKLRRILEDQRDVISLTIPMLIKLLEWAREEAGGDVEMHELVETLASHPGPLDTNVFDEIIGDSSTEEPKHEAEPEDQY